MLSQPLSKRRHLKKLNIPRHSIDQGKYGSLCILFSKSFLLSFLCRGCQYSLTITIPIIFSDICRNGGGGGWDINTNDLVITEGTFNPPCCLPGWFEDADVAHGPCAPGSPDLCGKDFSATKKPTLSPVTPSNFAAPDNDVPVSFGAEGSSGAMLLGLNYIAPGIMLVLMLSNLI